MRIKCTPDKGTVKTNIVERTIGRAVSVDTATSPFGPATKDLLGDTFHCLYGMELNPLKDEESPRDRLVNHALMKWLSKDEEFMQARTRTVGKLILSLISSKTLYEYLMTDEAIAEALKIQDEPPSMPQNMGGNEQKDEKSDNKSGGQGVGQSESKSPQEQQHEQNVQEALERIEQIQKNIIGAQIMSNASRKADESAEEAETFLKSWGVDPGEITIADVDQMMNLVNGNSEKMERIAELAGRFEGICTNALQKAREAYIGQVVDVHYTQDFTMMFSTELCYLMSPEVPQLIHTRYMTDFLSHGLLGFEARAEGKEFGSIYVMVDGSGSMNPTAGGFEIQAKAIALGLARAMQKDKLSDKKYTLCTFGSWRDPFFYVNSDDNMVEHFAWAEKFQNGGTNFDNAFDEAIKRMKDMPDGTDLVFITDGECTLGLDYQRKWRNYKNETNARLLYVDVSGHDNSSLRSISDVYMLVTFDKDGNMDMVAENIADSLATSIERARLSKLDDNS